MTFAFTSGNPDNLTSGNAASMTDIQGPFYDIRAYLNSGAVPPPTVGWTYPLSQVPVGDVGMLNQIRAGRQLTVADFTAMGLMQPVGLFNLSGLTNLGSGGALVNKGSVPFGVGINGAASTAAQFAGSTAQALYIADTGATDPFRIRTGSWGCWFRTAKRGVGQTVIGGKIVGASLGYMLEISTANVLHALQSSDGSTWGANFSGVSDVADDRWHHAAVTHDGTTVRLYVDGVLEATATLAGPLFTPTGPFNIGGYGADSGVAAIAPHYGRVDEAFVTPDILTDDQIRLLYCAKIPHTLGVQALRSSLNVRRRRRGGTLATTDFPSTPVRLHNFTAGALTDEGTGAVPLTINATAVPVAGADGDGETPNTSGNAYACSGGSGCLYATDAGLPAGTAARSFGCWFKTTTVGGAGIIGWGNSGAGSAQGAWMGTNGSGLLSNQNVADLITTVFVADGQWHFAVSVEDNAAGDGVKRKVYVDGRLVGGTTVLNSITLGGANRFRVAANSDGTGAMTGQFDGAFVTSVALTMEQIAALWAKGTQSLGASPKEPGAHVELMDGSNVLATFDTLDSTALVDLGVAA